MITVQQALHGYSDGHRLLAASTKLDSESARQLSMLTDLATLSSREFDGYLSGFFLEQARMYAFAKTWFAYEVPRPGCVWTHTLLIHENELGDVQHLRALVTAFNRPSVDVSSASPAIDLRPYSVPLAIEDSSLDRTLDATVPNLRELVTDLFSDSDKTIIVPSVSARQYEDAFLALWSLAWPQLRCRLAFRTSSTDVRKGHGRQFDLLATPARLTAQVERQAGNFEVVGRDSTRHETWASVLVLSLEREQRITSEFIKRVGPLFPPERTSVKASTELMIAWTEAYRDPAGLEQLIQTIRKVSPAETRVQLEQELLDPTLSDYVPMSDPLLLEMEITSPSAALLEPTTLHIPERLHNEARRQGMQWLIALLTKVTLESAITDTALDTFMENFGGAVGSLPLQLLPALARRHPAALAEIQLSSLPTELLNDTVVAALSSSPVSAEAVRAITHAEVARGSALYARQLFAYAPDLVVDVLLEMLPHRPSKTSGVIEWEMLAASHYDIVASRLMQTGNPTRDDFLFLASLIGRLDSPLSESERGVMKSLVSRYSDESNTGLCVAALVAGLRDTEDWWLMAASFSQVHQALAHNTLRQDEWVLLDPLLPMLRWKENSDRCRRLRNAVLRRFLAHGWPVHALYKDDDNLARQLARTLKVDLRLSKKAIQSLMYTIH